MTSCPDPAGDRLTDRPRSDHHHDFSHYRRPFTGSSDRPRLILDVRMVLLRPRAIEPRTQVIQVHDASNASNSGTAASAAFWVEVSVT